MSRRALQLDARGHLSNRTVLDNKALADLLAVLNRDGQEARVVGGAVRNALLGLAPGDIDVTTTARPDEVTLAAKAARFRVIPTGLSHGTVTVVVRGAPFEVTTLRKDVETDGRHAVVLFGRDFADDARRRDFTVNALSVDQAGRVHDCTGGLDDLAEGRVRFIGDARARIREDYLRVLRFFRFSARYAVGAFDPEGLAACTAEREGLVRLSRERVRAELLKLLDAPRAVEAVATMGETGVLAALLSGAVWPERLGRLAAIEAAFGLSADPIRSLAALALRVPADAARLRDDLRLSNEERDRLLRVASLQAGRGNEVPRPPDRLGILERLVSLGREGTIDALLLDHVDSSATPDDPDWQRAVSQAQSAAVPALKITGADILERGFTSGPLVGTLLKDVQARWIRAGFPEQPAALHRLLDEAVAAASPRIGPRRDR
jgi:poly(A) polymerase